MKSLPENRHQQVDRNGNPDLGAHGIFAGAIKSFDTQVLLNPFEKQLDLPARSINLRHRQCWQAEVVGQKHQRLARLRVAITDAAKRFGIGAVNTEIAQDHGLVETQSGGFVDGAGIAPSTTEILPGASDKESRMAVDPMQPSKIQIRTVHHIERAGFVNELIQKVDVVDTAGRDNNYGRDIALQTQERVKLDAAFVSAEGRPRKKREAQIDSGGVQRVGGLLQFGGKRLMGVERGGLLNQDLSEIGKDAPVARLVGIGQSASSGRFANTAVIELGAQSPQAGFDIAQTLAPSQLGKGHDHELLVAGQLAHAKVAAIPLDTFVEFVFGQAVQQLSENSATLVHTELGPPSGGARPCEKAL